MRLNLNRKCQIWLMGGLGNQLFQVNFGKWLGKELSIDIEYNTYLLRKNYVTKFLRWSIHDFFLQKLINFEYSFIEQNNIPAIIMSQFSIFENYSMFASLDKIPKIKTKNLYGYFQNPQFLSSTQHNLSLKANLLCGRDRYDTVMHLRGTDINNKKYALSYYFSVLDRLPSTQIHVVSDCCETINHFKSFFKKHEFTNIRDSSFEDFLTCCNARKLIIAPSTFSWWAARLGRAEDIMIPRKTYLTLGSPILRQNAKLVII